MRLLVSLGGLVAAALALNGCAPPPGAGARPDGKPYATINGKQYATRDEALEGFRQNYASEVAALAKEDDPLRGTALVVVPDHDRLRPLVTQEMTAALKRVPPTEVVEFVTAQRRLALRAEGDGMVASGVFEHASLREQNDTRDPDAGGADYLVWFQVTTALPDNRGVWIGRWVVRRAGSAALRGASVDPGVAPGAPRMASLMKSVRNSALGLGGVSIAGHGPDKPASAGSGTAASSGSGIIVDAAGDVLTNAHVVAGCTDPRVIDTGNATHSAAILARDLTNDLAILKVDAVHWQAAATFRESGDLHPGESVVVTGFPYPGLLGSEMAVTTGSLTALSGPRDDSRLLAMTAPVQPGNSGGPLLDQRGNIIGIVVSRFEGGPLALLTGTAPQNVNFAIKSTVVDSFLDAHHVGHAGAAPRQSSSAAEIGARARQFTVRVVCGR